MRRCAFVREPWKCGCLPALKCIPTGEAVGFAASTDSATTCCFRLMTNRRFPRRRARKNRFRKMRSQTERSENGSDSRAEIFDYAASSAGKPHQKMECRV